MKKVLCLLMCTAMILSNIVVPVNAANNSTCATYGFAVDTSDYYKIGYTDYLVQYVYYGSVVIGTSNTIMLFATQKEKVGSKYMNVAMYYTIMTPKGFTAKNQLGVATNYTGKSELLNVTTVLPKSTQSYRASYPENVAGASSYTLGGSASLSSKGVTVGITGSTKIEKNRLEVTNCSDVNKRKYSVTYDYKSAVLGTDATNYYLKNQTVQRGIFYYLTDGTSFSFPVTIKASFGAYYGVYWYSNLASSTKTWNIKLGS